jgi:hypothetical protein
VALSGAIIATHSRVQNGAEGMLEDILANGMSVMSREKIELLPVTAYLLPETIKCDKTSHILSHLKNWPNSHF